MLYFENLQDSAPISQGFLVDGKLWIFLTASEPSNSGKINYLTLNFWISENLEKAHNFNEI